MSDTPSVLYIYCTHSMALDILERGILHASPHCAIADPLMPGQHAELSFKRSELLKSSINYAVAMIFSSSQPQGDSPVVNAIKRWREEKRFADTSEAAPVLRELLSKMVDQQMLHIEKRLQAWRIYSERVRILSAFETVDNPLIWQYHADNHRGIALGLKTTEHNFLADASKVNYEIVRPDITTVKDQLDVIFHQHKDDIAQHFKRLLFSRPRYREFEQEWLTLVDTASPTQKAGRGNHAIPPNFQPDELASVYFGLNSGQLENKKCLSVLKKKYETTSIFAADIKKAKYELDFYSLEKNRT